jgi:serine/threonine protein kinase
VSIECTDAFLFDEFQLLKLPHKVNLACLVKAEHCDAFLFVDVVQGISMANENIQRTGASGIQLTPAQASKSVVEIAVERGYCSAQQVAQAREQHRKLGPNSNVELSQVLIDLGFLTQQQARACERATRGAQVIAGFEILEKVGQGGMGAVFRARQISMDRIVALKILPPKLAQDPGFKTRFLNEARVSAKLSHMNIINGIDCGEAGGYTFFAMEYVDGRTIKQIMKERGKYAPADALVIIRQMVDALAYAKSQGLVHRDVKPDNIMMTAGGIAKLCDLGLAKHVEGNEDASLTQSGQAVGTPHYIAPEQARGEAVDFNTDIYSLGATFYHMLTNKTPFDAPTSAAVMALHIANDTKNPCDLDASIPLGYGQVISRMMAKEKQDRYGNPDTLLADLDALEAGKAPSAATFKAKSSCLMPQSIAGNRGLRGRTTGPQVPVGIVRGTGPQVPVGNVRGTGPQVPISDNPHATGSRPRPYVRKQSSPWLPVGGVTIVVLVAMMFIFGKPNSSTMPSGPTGPVAPKPQPAPGDVTKEVKPPPPNSMASEKKLELPPAVDAKITAKTPGLPETPKEVVKAPNPTPEPPPFRVEPPPPVPLAVQKAPEPPPVPKFTLTPKMIHARFLAEMIRKTAKSDLAKVAMKDVHELAENPAYKDIHKDTQAELDNIEAALKFEQDAMKSMADRGVEIVLTDERAAQLQVTGKDNHLKVVEFRPEHGLSVQIPNGPIMPVKGIEIAGDQIIKNSPDPAVVPRLRYMMLRGNKDAFKTLLETVPGKDKAIWEERLALWNDGEHDGLARAEYDKLEKLAAGKEWKAFEALNAEFEKSFGTSVTAQENAVHLRELKTLAANTLRPPNPWLNTFHATINHVREDGFLELTYDFSTPEQAMDFIAMRGQPRIMDGHLFITNADDRGDRLGFAAPIADLRGLTITLKTQHGANAGFRIGIAPDGSSIGAKFLPFPLMGWDQDSARVYGGPAPVDTPTSELNLGDLCDLEIKSSDGKTFNWSYNGKALGNSPGDNAMRNGRIAVNFFGNGHNIWKRFKIIFRPDPALLNNRGN